MAQKISKKPSARAVANIRKRASMTENRVHIVSSGSKWAIRKEGAVRASKIVSTKVQAVKIAKSYVKRGDATTIISHKRDGTFTRVR